MVAARATAVLADRIARRRLSRSLTRRGRTQSLYLRTIKLRFEVGFDPAKSVYELPTVVQILRNTAIDAACDLVDRKEERHLSFLQCIEKFAVVADDLEDALTISDQFDFGKMFFKPSTFAQEVVRATHALQAHPSIEKRANDLECNEIAERVKPTYAWSSTGSLDAGLNETDAVPVPQLVSGAVRETGCLICRETLHKSARSSCLKMRCSICDAKRGAKCGSPRRSTSYSPAAVAEP